MANLKHYLHCLMFLFCLLISFTHYAQIPPVNACQGSFDAVFQRNLHLITKDMPAFPGGKRKLVQFLIKHMVFTEKGRQQFITGCYFMLVVEKDGSVKELKALGKGSSHTDLIKKGLLKVDTLLKDMPRWKPGKCGGKPVAFKVHVPITCIKYN